MRNLWAIPLSFVMLCLCCDLSVAQTGPSFVVIVHPSNPLDTVSAEYLADLFLRKRLRWDDEVEAQPVDLQLSNPLREAFSLAILERSSTHIKAYWNQQIYNGGLLPPPEVANETAAVAVVAASPGGVSYASTSVDLSSVKTIPVVFPPRRLSAPVPEYPPAARRARVSGEVVLSLTIDTSGGVRDVGVVSGLPFGLTDAAVDAVKRWRFAPAVCEGEPVEANVEYRVHFSQ